MLQQLRLRLRLPLALSWCSTAPLRFRKATTSLCLWRTASMMGVPLYLGADRGLLCMLWLTAPTHLTDSTQLLR